MRSEVDGKMVCLLAVIGLSTVMAIAAVVVGAINLTRPTKSGMTYNVYPNVSGTSSVARPHSVPTAQDSNVDRVWMIAIGHYDDRVEYLDPVSYRIKGYNVDVIDAVCDIANKDCELVNDPYERCFESKAGQRSRGGVGLMSAWYDACTGWAQTYERQLTYGFTEEFHKPDPVYLYVANETDLDSYPDLSGVKFGFINGWSTDEHCLQRYESNELTGVTLEGNRILHVPTPQDLVNAVVNGNVTVGFGPKIGLFESTLKRLSPVDFPNRCVFGGFAMMTQKKNVEFVRWWNDAFRRLVGTKRYDDICQNLVREHGGIYGDDPKDLCIGY